MKMVKSLLLGSAAGLVAVAGAQAADLPVKAKAVEYVKVCSLYGAGFYYIPGTDTCIKIGGFVRAEWNHNSSGSFATNVNGANAQYNRVSNTLIARTRGLVTFDTRSQTEYGTLRSYIRAGWQWTTDTDTLGGSATATYADRFFIQFAGFTFGKTQSFFDAPNIQYMTLSTNYAFADTGGSGTPVAAYTWQLGNGVTATLSLEDQSEREGTVVDLSTAALRAAAFSPAANNAFDTHGQMMPDIVANLRVDQAWGSAQVSGALHNVKAQYYGTPGGVSGQQGHPDDDWGWAVTAGMTLKMPWDPKDTLTFGAIYGEGATRYVMSPGAGYVNNLMANLHNPGVIGVAWADDAYFGASPGQLELSQAWSAYAGFEHFWTPTLRQSIHGQYVSYSANSATVDSLICGVAGNNRLGTAPAGCADWSAWQVGSRLLWNPVSNLDIGLEVMYSKVNTAFEGVTMLTGSAPDPVLRAGDAEVWSGIFRVQRNFWP